jgi:hypothetical protein
MIIAAARQDNFDRIADLRSGITISSGQTIIGSTPTLASGFSGYERP